MSESDTRVEFAVTVGVYHRVKHSLTPECTQPPGPRHGAAARPCERLHMCHQGLSEGDTLVRLPQLDACGEQGGVVDGVA